MFPLIGTALIVGSSALYWKLLPRNGAENPLVENSNIGSMVMIALMTGFVLGIALLWEGLFA